MSKQSGIIYDIGNDRFGKAIHKEQHEDFTKFGKVYIHVYTDRLCTSPEKDPVTGKSFVTLKHHSKIKAIGFCD